MNRVLSSIAVYFAVSTPVFAGIPSNPIMDKFIKENQEDLSNQIALVRSHQYVCNQALHKCAEGYANMTLNTDDSVNQRKINIIWYMAISKVTDEVCRSSVLRTTVANEFKNGLLPSYMRNITDLCVKGDSIYSSYYIGTDGRKAVVCPKVESDNWDKPSATLDF
jgi:hypothetical protein